MAIKPFNSARADDKPGRAAAFYAYEDGRATQPWREPAEKAEGSQPITLLTAHHTDSCTSLPCSNRSPAVSLPRRSFGNREVGARIIPPKVPKFDLIRLMQVRLICGFKQDRFPFFDHAPGNPA